MPRAIQIESRQRNIPVPPKLTETMRRCANEVLCRFGLFKNSEAYICLVSQKAIRQLNGEYRGVSLVTDVLLSFPAIDWRDATAGRIDSLAMPPDKNIETGRILLGDIAICCEQAQQQANEYGHSLMRELCFLTVHGMLHLLGFDHGTPSEEEYMHNITESVLGAFDIVRPKSVVQNDEK